MSQAAYQAPDAAAAEAERVIRQAAAARGWTDADLSIALDDVSTALDAADLWYVPDWIDPGQAGDFWTFLRDLADGWDMAGAAELRAWIDAAIATSDSEADRAEATGALAAIQATATGTAEDIAEAAAVTAKPWFWPVIGIGVTAVLAIALRR